MPDREWASDANEPSLTLRAAFADGCMKSCRFRVLIVRRWNRPRWRGRGDELTIF